MLIHSLKTTSQLTVFVSVNNFQRIASIFKCEMSSSLSLINCLRNQEANNIVFNSTVGETLLSNIILMAHLQNFSSASNQSSLLACSRVQFSSFLSKYHLNIEIISHNFCVEFSMTCYSACEVVSKTGADLCFCFNIS